MGPHAGGHGLMPTQHTEMQAAMSGKHTAMQTAMPGQHTEMQAAVATALGLTTDELQAQINAGKTVPQIAQEKGIDLVRCRGNGPTSGRAGSYGSDERWARAGRRKHRR
jgi:hypothetical protein